MQNQKPVKLYFFVTFLLLLALVVIGLRVKNYMDQKFHEQPAEQNEVKQKEKTGGLSRTLALVDVAVSASLVLVLIFLIVKMIMAKLRSF